MKKTILLAVAFVSIVTVSCKKERTCECSAVTSGGGFTSPASVTKTTAEKQTKKYFRTTDRCYSTTSKNTFGGIEYTTENTCTLK